MEVFAMIYELRVYQPVPGQMAKLLARFGDQLLPIWEKHGIRPIGFWTTLVGESSNEVTYTPVGVACRSRDEVDGIPE
jgi:NIPSNAP